MYAQITTIRTAPGGMPDLRKLLESEYLPSIRQRPGFMSAHLLEQIDEPDTAELLVFWDSQEAVENAQRTMSLQGSDQSIAARMHGVRMQRQGYIVRVSSETARTG
jgi:heme-degrading monooxygenase HmoA